MRHEEGRDDGVEGPVAERQRLRVGLLERHARLQRGGEREHLVGEVDRHDGSAAGGRAPRDVARTGRHVEDRRARRHPGGVEQRLRRPRGDGAEPVVVRRGAALAQPSRSNAPNASTRMIRP